MPESAARSTLRALRDLVQTMVVMAPRRLAATIALTFLAGLLEGVGLLALIPLLQLVGLDAQQGALVPVIAFFRQAFGLVGLVPTLPVVLASYVAIVAVQSVVLRQQAVVQAGLRTQVVHMLRTRLYRAIAGTTWSYFVRHRASIFGQMLTQQVGRVANAAFYTLDLFVASVLALVYIGVALRVSPGMTLLVVGCGGLLALVLRAQLTRARGAGLVYTDAWNRLYAATSDHLDSMKMAKGYGAEQRHADRFAELSLALGLADIGANAASVTTRQWVAVGSAALLALIVYVAQGVLHMPPASLFLLIFLFARLVPRVTAIYERVQMLALELPAFEAVLTSEAECLAAAEPGAASHEPLDFRRTIECRGITFGYREQDEWPALRDVSLSIRAHATTAIVGPSGAGKSTFADLLMGLLSPSSGELLVDDVPLTAERLQAWRNRIGYVAQETFLFHDTVRANLVWASPGADDGAVWKALEQAAAADFVRALPAGLDTIVGDRGVLLSGGERQRLSLARALLRQPQLLILDEATSSLDSENERRIQAAIDHLHEQITIVAITHRLSTIRNADTIYVVERGRIVESGSWHSLLAAPAGRFRALCAAQGIDVGPTDGAALPELTRS